METALKSVLAWWDDSGVDVPAIAPTKTRRKNRAASSPSNVSTNVSVNGAAQTPPAPVSVRASTPSAPEAEQAKWIAAAIAMADGAKTLEALKSGVEGFAAGALTDRARGAVFARGNAQADVMVIGEAPSVQDDAQGQPFAGPAGELLDKILGSIGLTEQDVYLTNIVNWRPLNNGRPTEADIAICRPIIHRHIALASPKVIVLIGGVAMSALTELKGITKCRGEWTQLAAGGADIPALVTYHPAYLLRQSALKADVWRDMLSLRAKLAAL